MSRQPVAAFLYSGANIVTSAFMRCYDVVAEFGADPTGANDSYAAVVAAEASRASTGGVLWWPPGVYRLGRPVSAAAVNWVGAQGSVRIFAGASMAALLALSGRCTVAGITFDGASLAVDVVRCVGAARSRFDQCLFIGGTRAGMRLAVTSTAAALGPIVQAGPGPALTVSQPDTTLAQYSSAVMCAKIQTGGPAETATYVFAPVGGTGGSFFGPFPLHAATRIPFLNGNSVYSDSGLLITTAAGTFQTGTTYTWTYGAPPVNANDRPHFLDCEASGNGIVYASSALAASYSGYPVVASAGTASIASGTTRVAGVNTPWLSTNATDGSMIYLPGAKFPGPTGRGTTTDMTMIVCILGDGEIEVDGTAGATVTNGAWSIGNGAGFWEDVGEAHANNSLYTHCEGHTNAGSAGRFGGLTGPLLLQFGHGSNSHAGRVQGTRSAD